VFKLPRRTVINFVLPALVVLVVFNSLTCFKNPVQNTFKPQLSLIGLIKRELLGIIFYHRNMVLAEKLERDANLLRLRLFDLRELGQENGRLKNLLNFKQKSPFRLIAARVIGRSPDSWSSSVIIDKGKYNGIKSGLVVISSQGLVGSVVEVSENTAKVLLINDPNQGVSAVVQRSRQEGLVNGTLGTNLIMRYLPDDADIAVGDIVITSELSQIYPKGLLVGRILNLGREFSGLNRYAIVKPAVDLASIEELLVIIP
jgi:rod shape-determining protein MreC